MAETTERIAILLELKNQEFEKRAKTAGAAIDRLERRFDPLAAAGANLEKQQLRFNAALEAGTIDAAQHAKGMALLQQQYDKTVSRVSGAQSKVVAMNSSISAQTGFMTRNRNVFQQAGYQVGDFAVQVQGGTSALTAFTQQGSQLLGVFGPWGAVMGAVLAVGAPLAGVLLGLGKATDETEEKARTFTERLGDADAALSAMAASAELASAGGLETLRKKYGELTDEVRDMAQALYEIDKREALAQVSGVISEITGEISKAVEASAGAVSSALATSGTEAALEAAREYRAEVEAIQRQIESRQAAGLIVNPAELALLSEMQEELAAMEGNFSEIGDLAQEVNISPDLLRDISAAQMALEAARDAGEFGDMATQLGIVRDLLVQAGDAVEQGVIDGITNAEARARDLSARLAEGEDAASGIAEADIAGGITPAVDEAKRLVDEFGIALSLARQIAANQAAAEGAGSGRGGDPRNHGGSVKDWQTNVPGAQLAYQPGGSAGVPLPGSSGGATSTRRTSSGGGAAQESLFAIADEELAKLKLQIEMIGKSSSEIAELTVKQNLLAEAKKRGLTITTELTAKIDAEAAEVGELAAQYEGASDKIAAMEQMQGQFKDSIIDAAMGGANAMESLTTAIKRAALEYALFGGASGGGLLGGLFGGSTDGGAGGGLGGFVKSLFSFDGGGYTGGGVRSGGLDGKGGTLAMLHPQETIIDHTKGMANVGQAASAGGAGGTVGVNISLDSEMLNATVDSRAQNVAVNVTRSGLESYDRQAAPTRQQQIANDPRRRG